MALLRKEERRLRLILPFRYELYRIFCSDKYIPKRILCSLFFTIPGNEIHIQIVERRIRNGFVLVIPCSLCIHQLQSFVESKFLGFVSYSIIHFVAVIIVHFRALRNRHYQNVVVLAFVVFAIYGFYFDADGRLTKIQRRSHQFVYVLSETVYARNHSVILDSYCQNTAVGICESDYMICKSCGFYSRTLSIESLTFFLCKVLLYPFDCSQILSSNGVYEIHRLYYIISEKVFQ